MSTITISPLKSPRFVPTGYRAVDESHVDRGWNIIPIDGTNGDWRWMCTEYVHGESVSCMEVRDITAVSEVIIQRWEDCGYNVRFSKECSLFRIHNSMISLGISPCPVSHLDKVVQANSSPVLPVNSRSWANFRRLKWKEVLIDLAASFGALTVGGVVVVWGAFVIGGLW